MRSGLEQAIRLDPANTIALAHLARAILQDDASAEGKADAEHLARLALQFDSQQDEARKILAQIEAGTRAK